MFKRKREPVPYTGKPHWAGHGHDESAERHGRVGWECWSRRDSIAHTVGLDIGDGYRKPHTHRMERRIAKRELDKELQDEASIFHL